MDYGFAGKRRTKGDRKAKRRFRIYKKGGKYRAIAFRKTNKKH